MVVVSTYVSSYIESETCITMQHALGGRDELILQSLVADQLSVNKVYYVCSRSKFIEYKHVNCLPS